MRHLADCIAQAAGALISAGRRLVADGRRRPTQSHTRRRTAITDFCVELGARGEPFWFTALGTSMEPSIPAQSALLITPCQLHDVRAGDVVMVRAGSRILVHRVVGKYLWGDNRPAADGLLSDFQVIGRVDAVRARPVVPRARRWLRTALSKLRASR